MRVSVVMPAYQAETYLAEAIESVLSQTHDDFELIVVDDGSTDGTRRIAEGYAERDARVHVHSRENRGEAASTSEGIALAKTEYVAIMHADDRMLPHRLERQIQFLDANQDVAVASSYVWYIGAQGQRIGEYRSTATSRDVVRERMQRGDIVAVIHPATMIRRSHVLAVGGYRSKFEVTEDIDLWSRLLESGRMVLVQPEFLLEYRIHGSSGSVTRQRYMRKETRWVVACNRARAEGREEPTFEQYMAAERAQPLWHRLRIILKDEAMIQYKAAVHAYARRRPLVAVGHVLLSTLMWPRYAPGQVLRKWKWNW